MPPTPEDGTALVVRPDADSVAALVAERLVARLAEIQAQGRVPRVVLTGGTISRTVHRAVAAHGGVDWSRVEVWWGDDRYVAGDDPERNARQAHEDLLDVVGVPADRVHAMPAADEGLVDVEAAAASYAVELVNATAGLEDEAWFDVLMLGLGPDGHCASLFPGQVVLDEPRLAVAVTDSPKPPPQRVSLSMPVLHRADEVWFVAAGAEKARAVARSVAGRDVQATPSAGPRGIGSTTWFLDIAAASGLVE